MKNSKFIKKVFKQADGRTIHGQNWHKCNFHQHIVPLNGHIIDKACPDKCVMFLMQEAKKVSHHKNWNVKCTRKMQHTNAHNFNSPQVLLTMSNDIPVVIVDDIQMLVSFERNQKTTNHSGKLLSYLQIIFSLNEENCRKWACFHPPWHWPPDYQKWQNRTTETVMDAIKDVLLEGHYHTIQCCWCFTVCCWRLRKLKHSKFNSTEFNSIQFK